MEESELEDDESLQAVKASKAKNKTIKNNFFIFSPYYPVIFSFYPTSGVFPKESL
jgi:hypothetical protein